MLCMPAQHHPRNIKTLKFATSFYESANHAYRIKNPLAGLPRDTLLQNVADFAQEKGLMDQFLLLQKGALVARDPTNYEDIQDPRRACSQQCRGGNTLQ